MSGCEIAKAGLLFNFWTFRLPAAIRGGRLFEYYGKLEFRDRQAPYTCLCVGSFLHFTANWLSTVLFHKLLLLMDLN